MATKTRGLPKVASYVKNVGRSVAYASIDYVKTNASGIADFLETNQDILKEGYSYVRNARETARKVDRDLRKSNLYKAMSAGVNNFKEDISTGNFWNTDREKAVTEEALGLGEFDDSEFDFGSSEPTATSTITDSFNKAIGAAAASQGNIVAASTDAMLKGNLNSTKMMIGGLEKLGAQFGAGMGALFTQVQKTNKILEGPMMAHMENSKKFYETSTMLMQKQTAMMEEILQMQRNLYKIQQTAHPADKISGSMKYNGSMDIRGYLKNIKGNIKDLMDSNGLGMMDSMDLGGGNPLLLFTAAPIKIIMQTMMDNFMSKDFKKSLQSFDKSMTSVFSQFVARINKKAKDDMSGGFMGMLYEILGVKQDIKNTINTSNYNRGPVPFDGVTRKTIIEVIPGYLARIEAALTGREERHFDSRSGTWKSARRIQEEFDMEKQRAVLSANYGARSDVQKAASKMNPKDAKKFMNSADKAFFQIFDDGGDFNPKMKDAWKHYGFKNEREFEMFRKSMSYDSIRSMAMNNMNSRGQYSRRIRELENSDSMYKILFSGAYDESGIGKGSRNDPSKYGGGTGILAASRDKDGKNVFWYLKEILRGISARHSDNLNSSRTSDRRPRGRSVRIRSMSSGGTGSDESSDDGEDDSPISDETFYQYEEDMYREKEKEDKQKAFGNWLSKKLENTKVGKALLNTSNSIGKLFAAPIKYATDLLNKADESMFKLMFGDKFEMTDREGNKIDNVFKYITTKVKETFEDLTKNIKEGLKKYLFESKFWKEYVKPFGEEIKNKAKTGVTRVKDAFSNVFGNFRKQPGVSASDVEESAYGRYVDGDEPILSMLSPGEVVLPASLNTGVQNRQLRAEKRSKNNILKAIKGATFNAKGNVDTDQFKDLYKWFRGESKGKGGKIAAGGAIGGVGGLIAGFNPILGALAGSAISFVKESESAKNFLFGEERDGSGVIPKKAVDFFKKHGKSMGDFGIVGGILGLLTPFGILGGAAMGAGIGYLKNSESFKKFIFGDAETGKDGLIKKESLDKFKDKVKKAAPNLIAGAGIGILAGPFGLIGNAAMGAGLGLLTSTETFHKVMFGDKENNPDDEGLIGAFKDGVIDPVKEQMKKFADDFKNYAKKNILDPMKNFWAPFNQMLKNTVISIGDRISDFMKSSYENTIGRPVADFVKQKLLKPMTKTVMTILKAPVAVGKAVVAAPFRALGGIGNSMRMNQIRKGTARDMSAADRLAFREQHKGRDMFSHFADNDKMRDTDLLLSKMSDEDIATFINLSGIELDGRDAAGKKAGDARKATGQEISNFMNRRLGGGKNIYDKVGYGYADKIYKSAANGDMDKVEALINGTPNLTKEEKAEFIENMRDKVEAARQATESLNAMDISDEDRNAKLAETLGMKKVDNKTLRNIRRLAQTEFNVRGKRSKEAAEIARLEEENKTPEEKTVDRLDKGNEFLEKIWNTIDELVHGKKKKTDSGEQPLALGDGSQYVKDDSGRWRDKTTGRFVSKDTVASAGTSLLLPAPDEDSKEAKEAEEKEKEAQETEERETAAEEKSSSFLQKIHDKLLGADHKKETGGIMGKVFKYFGIGAKVAAGAVGISLFGHATEWFKTNIWPNIKSTLLGDENTGQEGMLQKIFNWFGDKFTAVKNWFDERGGFSNMLYTTLVDKVLPYLIKGFGYAVDNVVAPLTALLIKSAPKILVGLAKGLISGLKMAIFNKDLERTTTIDDGGVTDEIKSISTSNSSNLTAGMPSTLSSSLRTSFGAGRSSAYSGASTTLDLSSIASSEDTNNTSKTISDKLLGSTSRTNDVVMDENGNITTTYTQNNTTESVASLGAKAAGRGFLQGLSGLSTPATKLTSKLANLKVLPNKASRIFTLNPLKWGYRTAKAGAKVTGGAVTGATNAGTSLRNIILGNTDNAANTASKYAKNAAGRWYDTTTGKFVSKATAEAAESASNVSTWQKIKNFFTTPINAADDAAEAAAKSTSNSNGLFSRIKQAITKTGAFGEEVLDDNLLDAAVKPGKSTLWTKLKGGLSKVGEKLSKTSAGSKVTNAVSTTKNGVSAVLGKAKTAVTSSKTVQTVTNTASKFSKGFKAVFEKLAGSKFGSWFCKIGKKIIGSQIAETTVHKMLMEFAEGLAKKAGTKLIGSAAKSVLNAIGGLSPLALILIVNDLWHGWNNAETILGVADNDEEFEVGVGHRLACAVLHAINQKLTLGLIPTETIMDLIIEFIFPIFKLDATSLKEAQSRAASYIDEWNEENPDETYDNLEDYNKRNNLWTKLKKALGFKVGGTATKEETSDSSGSGGGRKSSSGKGRYGRGHVYQGSRGISNIRYGDSTIGESGCAPVAATNLINSMYGGSSLSEAASYAERNGMTVRGGGTDIDYFNSYLGSKGIPTRNTSSRSDVLSALKSGQQVIMLGNDGANYSGAPFGANDHFITAKGIDRKGNIIVEDPDMPQANIAYNKNNVLNSMTKSVVAGSSRRSRRYGRARNDAAVREAYAARMAAESSSTNNDGTNLGPNAILNVARSQIGINDGGTNKCKFNHAYYKKNVSGSSYPWCCVFVWWVFNQAGAADLFYGGQRIASCSTLRSYHWNKGQRIDTPQAGDVIFFNWSGGTNPQHVGIVTSVNADGTVNTIEGNTSSNGSQTNGGNVMEKTRNTKNICGYYRPEYPYDYNSSKVVDMSEYGDTTDYKDIAINGGQMTGDTVSFANSGAYVSSDDIINSEESSSSFSSVLTALKEGVTSIIKSFFGEDAYNALFGDTSTTTDNTSSSGLNMTASGNYSSITPTESAKKIWTYLKKKGYSDYAASGIMGCWQQESSNRADRVEGDYLSSFPGFETVLSSNSALNDYTTNKLFPAYARSNISIDKSAYKGTDGNYYPGIGLAQWTGPRGYNLFKYANDNNQDWRNLDTQLGFFSTEDASGGLMDKLNQATSAADGAHKALDYYEMYEGYGAKAPSALNARVAHANTIYDTYKDYDYEAEDTGVTTTKTGDIVTVTTENGNEYRYTEGRGSATRGSGRSGKGRGSYGGSATAALRNYASTPRYYGGAGTEVAPISNATASTGTVDYATFLQTVVSILMSIADNTAILTKILDILADNFDIKIDKSDIEVAHQGTLAQTESALNQLVARSSGNNRNISKLLNNKDTSYILNAMSAIASE